MKEKNTEAWKEKWNNNGWKGKYNRIKRKWNRKERKMKEVLYGK